MPGASEYSKELVAVYCSRIAGMLSAFLDCGTLTAEETRLAKGALGTLKALRETFRQVPEKGAQ